LQYLAGHFDTEVGAKADAQSYKNIAEKIGNKTEEMVFYTDILKGKYCIIISIITISSDHIKIVFKAPVYSKK
jgi:methionine salvage enolase-phosphatase E1